jgi:hypothetical protein
MRSRTHSVSADRPGDVLELLLAAILEANIQLAFDLAVYLLRNQDAAWIGAPLQPDSYEPPRVCRRPFGLSYAAMAGCSSMA